MRHAVLRLLVADIGESCNLTMLSGVEVVYLNRIESAFPLQLNLRPGTRVPVHCSASGKLILAHMPQRQRAELLGSLPLARYTATTLTSNSALEDEFVRIRKVGYAVDAGVCGRSDLRRRARVRRRWAPCALRRGCRRPWLA